MSMLNFVKRITQNYWEPFILCVIGLTLFFIPMLLWGNLYVVGGDDSRLYYLFPEQYLKNYSFNIISNNTLGGNLEYFPVSFSAPMIIILYLLKGIFPLLQTQFLMHGLILSFGFIFFYLFLRELFPKPRPYFFWSAVVASLYYIFCNYLTRTFFQHQQLSIYLIMVFPFCLYAFISGVRKESMVRIVLASLFFSMFSSTFLSMPWMLATIVTLVPFFVFIAYRFGLSAWKALGVFIITSIMFNMFWIIHFIVPFIYKTGEISFISTLSLSTFKQQNSDLISALAYLNSPFHQLLNVIRTSWGDRQGITFMGSFGVLYLIIILLAGVLLRKTVRSVRSLYLISVTGLLFAMAMITPNFGQWNLQLFLFMNNHIPLFAMFRNMYDKFSLAMAFHYAFALFAALVIIGESKISTMYKYFCIVALAVLTIATAFPLLHPTYTDTDYSTRISGHMNSDYNNLTTYLRDLEATSRFVWMPMTYTGYVYISDEENPNHYYAGTSPLQILAGASDIAGFYGIQTRADSVLGWKVLDMLRNRSYEEIGMVFQKQNIGYVIVNHEIGTTNGFNLANSFDFIALQTDEFKRVILGEKVRDFGLRYSLYRINPKFAAPTIFLTDTVFDYPVVDSPVVFHKSEGGTYDVAVVSSKPTNLVMLEPYNRLWELTLIKDGKRQRLQMPNVLAYGFGNAWHINPSEIATNYPEFVTRHDDGSYSFNARIYFLPNMITWPTIVVSIVFTGLSILYVVISMYKRKS